MYPDAQVEWGDDGTASISVSYGTLYVQPNSAELVGAAHPRAEVGEMVRKTFPQARLKWADTPKL